MDPYNLYGGPNYTGAYAYSPWVMPPAGTMQPSPGYGGAGGTPLSTAQPAAYNPAGFGAQAGGYYAARQNMPALGQSAANAPPALSMGGMGTNPNFSGGFLGIPAGGWLSMAAQMGQPRDLGGNLLAAFGAAAPWVQQQQYRQQLMTAASAAQQGGMLTPQQAEVVRNLPPEQASVVLSGMIPSLSQTESLNINRWNAATNESVRQQNQAGQIYQWQYQRWNANRLAWDSAHLGQENAPPYPEPPPTMPNPQDFTPAKIYEQMRQQGVFSGQAGTFAATGAPSVSGGGGTGPTTPAVGGTQGNVQGAGPAATTAPTTTGIAPSASDEDTEEGDEDTGGGGQEPVPAPSQITLPPGVGSAYSGAAPNVAQAARAQLAPPGVTRDAMGQPLPIRTRLGMTPQLTAQGAGIPPGLTNESKFAINALMASGNANGQSIGRIIANDSNIKARTALMTAQSAETQKTSVMQQSGSRILGVVDDMIRDAEADPEALGYVLGPQNWEEGTLRQREATTDFASRAYRGLQWLDQQLGLGGNVETKYGAKPGTPLENVDPRAIGIWDPYQTSNDLRGKIAERQAAITTLLQGAGLSAGDTDAARKRVDELVDEAYKTAASPAAMKDILNNKVKNFIRSMTRLPPDAEYDPSKFGTTPASLISGQGSTQPGSTAAPPMDVKNLSDDDVVRLMNSGQSAPATMSPADRQTLLNRYRDIYATRTKKAQ